MKPLNVPSHFYLSVLLVVLFSCSNPAKKESTSLKAEDSLTKARSYNDSGLAFTKKNKDYNKAIEYFNKALSVKPDYDVALSNRANAYRLLKEYDKALVDFDHAISINPTDTLLHLLKARVYEDSKEYEKAIKELDMVLMMHSKDSVLIAKTYHERGKAYENLGKNKLAEEDFRKAKLLGY